MLQYSRPENANLVREALKLAGREDLIGNSPECLVREAFGKGGNSRYIPEKKGRSGSRSKGGRSVSDGPKKKEKFYQPILDQRKPKKSKLERVFGDEARAIYLEAAKMSDGGSRRRTNASSSAQKSKKAPARKNGYGKGRK